MRRNLSEGLRFWLFWTRFYSFDITWCLSCAPLDIGSEVITSTQWCQPRPILGSLRALLNAGTLVFMKLSDSVVGLPLIHDRAVPFWKDILCTALRKRLVCFKNCPLVWRKFNPFSRCGNLSVNQIAGCVCTIPYPKEETFLVCDDSCNIVSW